ncbi:MAG: hypothetical protein ABF289_13820 [Clostridiales bacterium]
MFIKGKYSVHWLKLCERYEIHKIIKLPFLSYKIGYMKPDDKIKYEPSKILFFDDNINNINADKKYSIPSIYINNGFKEVTKICDELILI